MVDYELLQNYMVFGLLLSKGSFYQLVSLRTNTIKVDNQKGKKVWKNAWCKDYFCPCAILWPDDYVIMVTVVAVLWAKVLTQSVLDLLFLRHNLDVCLWLRSLNLPSLASRSMTGAFLVMWPEMYVRSLFIGNALVRLFWDHNCKEFLKIFWVLLLEVVKIWVL